MRLVNPFSVDAEMKRITVWVLGHSQLLSAQGEEEKLPKRERVASRKGEKEWSAM